MFSVFIECNIANTEVTRVNMLCERAVWIQLPITTLVGSHLRFLESSYEARPDPVLLTLLSMWRLTLAGPEFVSPLKQVITLNLYARNQRVL